MAVALYTKYRPDTFDNVVGQDHVVTTLKNAILSKRLSHAYLFCGPRGTGKTTMARIIAKACICKNGVDGTVPTASPCGVCDDCVDISTGTHEDVSELDAASRTGVDSVREEIINRVQFAPSRGLRKVYIIDEVHMLSTAAFNALLKTLEEPPNHVIFVLCTTDPQKVPETIISRCQRFDFKPISLEDVIARLQYVCQQEDATWEDDALKAIAKNCQGGMRNALTQLEQSISFGNGHVCLEALSQKNAMVGFDDSLNKLLEIIAANDLSSAYCWVDDYCNTAYDFDSLISLLINAYRNIFISISGSRVKSNIPVQVVQLYTGPGVQYILSQLSDLANSIRTAVNKRLCFEVALSKITLPQLSKDILSYEARIAQLEKEVAELKESAQASNSIKFDSKPATDRKSFSSNSNLASENKNEQNKESDSRKPFVPNFSDFNNNQTDIKMPNSSIPNKWPSDNDPVINKKLNTHPDVSFDTDNIELPSATNFDFTNEDNIHKLWQKVYSQIKIEYPMYAALLQKGSLVYDIDEKRLIIEMPAQHGLYLDTFKTANNRQKIKDIFSSVLKCPFELSMRVKSKPKEKANLMEILKEVGATNITTEDNS